MSHTIFVCSTFSDLREEREAVLHAIGQLKLQHDSMEFFGARTAQPLETCVREVRASDILVVIVGHRYGSVVPGSSISYSETEYQEGFRLGKPCLVYVRGDNVAVLPRHIERDATKIELLETWKSTLQSRHTVASFESANDLAARVTSDIARVIQDLEEATRLRAEAPRLYTRDEALEAVVGIVRDAFERGASPTEMLAQIHATALLCLPSQGVNVPAVLVSYAQGDYGVAQGIANGLKAQGVNAWLDRTSEWRSNADEWNETDQARSGFVVFLMSPHSLGNEFLRQQLQVALHRQISGERTARILPVLVNDADVPPLLRQYQWIDLREGGLNGAVARLAAIVLGRSHP